MKTANNALVLAALLAGMATGWLGAAAGGGTRPPELADGNLLQTASPDDATLVRPDATNDAATDGEASAHSDAPLRPAANVRPIRPSSDTGVQRRILAARVATLEKQLAAAKRRAEARKAETEARESETIEYLRETGREYEVGVERTGKKNRNAWTVGECLQYAPVWFEQNVGRQVDRAYAELSRLSDALAVLDSVDVSRMTDEERAVHESYVEALSEFAERYAAWLDMTDTDDAVLEEVWSGMSGIYKDKIQRLRPLADYERDTLRSMVLRSFGVTEDEAEGFRADEQRAFDSVTAVFDCPLRIAL